MLRSHHPVRSTRQPARRFTILVFLIGAVIALALLAGQLDHPNTAPADDGAPADVTTIATIRPKTHDHPAERYAGSHPSTTAPRGENQ